MSFTFSKLHSCLFSTQLAGWTSKTWGSTWPGCTTSTCSLLASMSWNHGKNPSLTLFSSLPSQWWFTPHTCSCPSTCAWLWSFSLGSLAANRKAPWHSWLKTKKEKRLKEGVVCKSFSCDFKHFFLHLNHKLDTSSRLKTWRSCWNNLEASLTSFESHALWPYLMVLHSITFISYT